MLTPSPHFDNHVHTSLCMHAVGSMEDYVKSAIDRGLAGITFLEHLEEGIDYSPRTWLEEADFDYYFTEGRRLQQRYGEHLRIRLGVEAGYNPACSDTIAERLRSRTWDCIGLSYHFCRIPELPEHLNMLSRKKKNITIIKRYGADRLLCHYFDMLIEAIDAIPAQVLCHLDAGLRHFPNLQIKKEHWRQIDRLLQTVKRAGMALEINTSGYALRGEPFPRLSIVRRAQDLEIPLVAGSDAHQPADVGRYFDRLPALLSQETHP